jgi:hypothetical protein
MRFRLDQFCGLAGSSVVYQSTKMIPSVVFFGTIGDCFGALECKLLFYLEALVAVWHGFRSALDL